MTKPNDSILVTPGTGATVGTHLLDSKEYQGVVVVDPTGHVYGSHDLYVASDVAMAKAASKNYISVFNADATLIVDIVLAVVIQEVTAAVTGLVRGYRLFRITSVHSGGTSLTPTEPDTNAPALDADITARSNGQTASAGDRLWVGSLGEEETGPSPISILWSEAMMGQPIVCRQNQGVLIQQDATAGVGVLSAAILFRVR